MSYIQLALAGLPPQFICHKLRIFLRKRTSHRRRYFGIEPQLQNFLAQLLVWHIVAAASGFENMRCVFVQPKLVTDLFYGLEPRALNELKQAGC